MDDQFPTIEAQPTQDLDATQQQPPQRSCLSKALIAGGVLAGVAVVAVVAGFLIWNSNPVQQRFTAPLGPTLVPADTSIQPRTFSGAGFDAGDLQAGDIETVCDGPPQMLILAVGADATGELTQGGLADSIRVIRADFRADSPSVSALTIPRDTWVEIPNLGDSADDLYDFFGDARDPEGNIITQEGDWGKINTAYLWGNSYGLPGGGPQILAETVYLNFGIPVEHYGAVNMEVMAEAIDAVGGVTINVQGDVGGFSPGVQRLTGEEAVRYARVRSTDNDFFRTERQNQVLLALREEYIKPENYARLPQIVDRLLERTQTDLSRQQVLNLACLATRIDPEDDIRGYALNNKHLITSYTTNGSFILLQDDEAVQGVLDRFFDVGE